MRTENWEVDFAFDHEMVQVCYHLNDENKARELKGLASGMKYKGLQKASLITYDQELKLEDEGNVYYAKPFWKVFG